MFLRHKDKNERIYYTDKYNNKITDKKNLTYINSLVIPPAWKNVTINKKNQKILAIGVDSKDRTQYIYSNKFIQQQKNAKFDRICLLAKKINKIMNKIHSELISNYKAFNKQACINLILYIVFLTGLRIGNKENVKKYNSFGVSTLLGKHVRIKDTYIEFNFIGKKGVQNKSIIDNPMVVTIIKGWKRKFKITKNDLFFQYKHNKNTCKINGSDVNKHLKIFGEFTVKDFRTLNANIYLIHELYNIKLDTNNKVRLLNSALRKVANKLNNTLIVCKKEYCNPNIIDSFLKNPLKFKNSISKPNKHKFVETAYLKALLYYS